MKAIHSINAHRKQKAVRLLSLHAYFNSHENVAPNLKLLVKIIMLRQHFSWPRKALSLYERKSIW